MVDAQDIALPSLPSSMNTERQKKKTLKNMGHDTEQGIERELRLTKEEEQFLIESELSRSKAPCFDGLALRCMGLTEREAELVQVFFMKARAISFAASRYSPSECLGALISSLEFLPTTDKTGAIGIESCETGNRFRQEYAKAVILSHREKVSPLLLDILRKVFAWIEGKYPQRETRGPSEGESATTCVEASATRKQKKLLARLTKQVGTEAPVSLDYLSRKEASLRITELLARAKQGAHVAGQTGDARVLGGDVGVPGSLA